MSSFVASLFIYLFFFFFRSHFAAGTDATDLVLRETELPMDSDIGLRSPQDSILARRRREFRRKQQSSHSDSNSCDTPTSENSPRDLTISKPITSEVTAQLPLTPSLVKKSPSPPRTPTILSFKGKFFSKVNLQTWHYAPETFKI